MAKHFTKLPALLALVTEHGPVSPNRLTELSGDLRQSIDRYIRQAHQKGLIHIAEYGPSPLGGNHVVKLYAIGRGVDAERPYFSAKRKTRAQPKKGEMRCKAWSDKEMRVLRAVRRSGQSVKAQLHRFPGRTLSGVEHQMRKLAREMGPKKRARFSWVWSAAHALLKEESGMTAHEISRRVGCSYRQASQVLFDQHKSDSRCIYISGWEKHGVNQIPQWAIGKASDAPKLPTQSIDEVRRKARMRHHLRRVRSSPFAVAMNQIMREAA